jgi:hypothetical protein
LVTCVGTWNHLQESAWSLFWIIHSIQLIKICSHVLRHNCHWLDFELLTSRTSTGKQAIHEHISGSDQTKQENKILVTFCLLWTRVSLCTPVWPWPCDPPASHLSVGSTGMCTMLGLQWLWIAVSFNSLTITVKRHFKFYNILCNWLSCDPSATIHRPLREKKNIQFHLEVMSSLWWGDKAERT